MKYFHFILITLFLIACGDSNNEDSDKGILIKASGLTNSVTLNDSISELNFEIPNDGNHYITLPEAQTNYDIRIVISGQQACTLNDELELICNLAACNALYAPVCAKKPLAGIVCVTSPCETDKYLTYGNSCEADVDNALIALHTECGGLEDLVAFPYEPAYITNLALVDFSPNDEFTIISASIIDDALTLQFEVSGGCGSHDFGLFVNDIFEETHPVQLSSYLTYQSHDNCEALITVDKTFDLLPLKEIFHRAYPDSTGDQSINLDTLGTYHFVIQ